MSGRGGARAGSLGVGLAAAAALLTAPALFAAAWVARGNTVGRLWARVDTFAYGGTLWFLWRWPAPGAHRVRALALLYVGLGLASALLHGHIFPGKGLEFSGDRKWRGQAVYQTSDAEFLEGLCHVLLHAGAWAMMARGRRPGGTGASVADLPPHLELLSPLLGPLRRPWWPGVRTALAPLLFGFLLFEFNPRALTWSMYATVHPATLNRVETSKGLDEFMEIARANDFFTGRGTPWLHAHFQRRGREITPHAIALPFYQGLDIAPLKQMQQEIPSYTVEEREARADKVVKATRSEFWRGKYLASLEVSSGLGGIFAIHGKMATRALTMAVEDNHFKSFVAHAKKMHEAGEIPLVCGTLLEVPIDSLYKVYTIYDAIPKDQIDKSVVADHIFSRLVLYVDRPWCGQQKQREVTPLRAIVGRSGADLIFGDSTAPRSGMVVSLAFLATLLLDILFVVGVCYGEARDSVRSVLGAGVRKVSQFGGWVEFQMNETFGTGTFAYAADGGGSFFHSDGERMENGEGRGPGAGGRAGEGEEGDARWEKFQHGINNLVKDAEQREEARALLGVSPEATPEDVRRSYKRLAVQWHPDKNRDRLEEAEEMFKRVQQAASILLPKDQ